MPFSRTSLYEHDRTWAWKVILRAFAIIFDIVGIGLIAWALAVSSRAFAGTSDYYYYYNDDTYAIPWNLITVRFPPVLPTINALIWPSVHPFFHLVSHQPLHPLLARQLDPPRR